MSSTPVRRWPADPRVSTHAEFVRGSAQSRDLREVESRDTGMVIVAYLLAGIGFYGGIGAVADHVLHTGWLLPLGMVLGMVASIYLVIKRFGNHR